MAVNLFPMNAKAAKDKFEKLMHDDTYIAQEKIDGVRALIHIPRDGDIRVTTRGASLDAPGVPIDITHRLAHVIENDDFTCMKGSIIDCEITIDGLDSSQIAGVVSYKSRVDVPDGLRFNVFDLLAFRGELLMNMPQAYRINLLVGNHSLMPDCARVLPIYVGTEKKFEVLDNIWKNGGEGIMLKNLRAKYFPDKRPTGVWYKVKKVDSVDAKIIGSEAPEKYYKDPETGAVDMTRLTKPYANGWFGALVYQLDNGVTGTVSGFDDEEKTLMSRCHQVKPEFLGRYMELKFMEKTKDGKLRHPRFIRLRDEIEK